MLTDMDLEFQHSRDCSTDERQNRLLAQVSHDLSTPLTPVFLLLSHMLQDPRTPEHLREKLEVIQRNLELQKKIIHDLQEAAHLRHGKLLLEVQPVHVHALLEEALDVCRSWLEDARLKVSLDLAAARDLVIGDGRRLLQVFWNLLQNAAKYTPAGGSVWLRTYNRNAATPPDRLMVEIHDSGVGIEAQHLASVFDPFEQETQAISRGLGLGLYIARSVVELHGGSLQALSEGKGRGSTFTIELPVMKSERSVRHPGNTDRSANEDNK